MLNQLDQIEIKFKDGAPIWVYIQELVPLTDPSGNVVSTTLNRIPLDPSDSRVSAYFGAATSDALGAAQKQAAIAADAVASRDAALARVDNLESQITALQAQAAELQAKLDAQA